MRVSRFRTPYPRATSGERTVLKRPITRLKRWHHVAAQYEKRVTHHRVMVTLGCNEGNGRNRRRAQAGLGRHGTGPYEMVWCRAMPLRCHLSRLPPAVVPGVACPDIGSALRAAASPGDPSLRSG
jgi:hypothetical protein